MYWYLATALFVTLHSMWEGSSLSEFNLMTTLFFPNQRCQILSSRYFEQNDIHGYVYNVSGLGHKLTACSVSKKPEYMNDKLLNVLAYEPDSILQNMPLVFCSSNQNYTNNISCMISVESPYYAVLNDQPFFAQDQWNTLTIMYSIMNFLFTNLIHLIIGLLISFCVKPYSLNMPDTNEIIKNTGIQIIIFIINVIFIYGFFVQPWNPYININYPILFLTPVYLAFGAFNVLIMSLRTSCYKKSTYGTAEWYLMSFLIMTNLPMLVICIIFPFKYDATAPIYIIVLFNIFAVVITIIQVLDIRHNMRKNMTNSQLVPLNETPQIRNVQEPTLDWLPTTETEMSTFSNAIPSDVESQSDLTNKTEQV